MPRIGVIYDLLISCPGDVTEEVDIIKKVVESFNRMFGSLNNISINTKHWSKDSYPQSGDKAQELLNKQFVSDCDAAVVVFWTRFGTPTDKYQSGTEEEIEEMLKMGKQIFMYFSDKPRNPSDIDSVQYKKVKAFREKYKDRGIYHCYEAISEFERSLLNHLSLYFLNIITSHNIDSKSSLPSRLIMQGLKNGKPVDILYAKQCAIWPVEWIVFIESNIEALFGEISKIDILEAKQVNGLPNGKEESDYDKPTIPALVNLSKTIALGMAQFKPNIFNASVPENAKTTILRYLEEKGRECPQGLFDLGNLKKVRSTLVTPLGVYGPSFEGTEDEKKKYDKLMELWTATDKHLQITEYFSELNKLFIIPCIISNVGKSFDEDIDIKVRFPYGYICKVEDFPIPGNEIISSLQEYTIVKKIFTLPESLHVEEFSNYPNTTFPIPYLPVNPLFKKSAEKEYEENLQEYRKNLEDLFCYRYFEDDDGIVMTFNIPYLKQNTRIGFPSLLYFKKLPEFIEYEICSKQCPEVLTGTLKVTDN